METAEIVFIFAYIYVLYQIVTYNHAFILKVKEIKDKEFLEKELKVENMFINIYLLSSIAVVVYTYFVFSFYAFLVFVLLTFILIWSYAALKQRIRVQLYEIKEQ